MAIKIQLRRGTAAQWTSANPVLMEGEMGVETDTLKVKLGNGSSAWTALPYFTQGVKGDTGATGPTGATGLTGAKGDKGDTGNPGPANTLTVGTVTTGAAGSPATVTITGDAPNQTISFQIPQGVQGIQGIQGPQGVGVPTGGTEGQIIVKTVDGTAWVDNVVPQVKYTVKNSSGSTIPKGSVVYISGSNGTNILISLADADTEATSSKTVGIVETDIVNNAFGYVVTEGLLAGLNTSGATAGDSVWLSSTAGAFVFGAPPAKPAHSVYLGVVSRVNSSNGEIFVKVQNGYELEELHNVEITSPADKQVLAYEGGLWKNKVASGGVTVSEPAPSSPIDGDGWFYATDGTLFVRYNDGNSTQWVQPNAVLSSQIEQRYHSPNYIINGGFDIWQRGTSGFVNNAYCADRWVASISNSAVSRSTVSVGNATTYGITFTTSAATNTSAIIQALESIHANALRGKTVTLSFYAQASVSGATLLGDVQTSSTADSFNTGFSVLTRASFLTTTSWTRYSVTATVPADATSAGIRAVITATNLPSGATITYTGVQLEEGPTATAFRRNANSIQGELAACQRYYWRISGTGDYTFLTQGWQANTTSALFVAQAPVSMRTAPSVTGTNVEVTDEQSYNAVPSSIAISQYGSDTRNIAFTATFSASGAQYRPCNLRRRASQSSGFLEFNAEL